MSVLVTGGAGYIGSHTVHRLLHSGRKVVVLDNLCTGHRWAVPKSATWIEGDAGNVELLSHILSHYEIDSVIHFAGSLQVEESTRLPLKYYENNTLTSFNLIKTCHRMKIRKFIFSSTAAVYGSPDQSIVNEEAPTNPINPYGRSKLVTEWILKDLRLSSSLHQDAFQFVALRYFNVAGAMHDLSLGQVVQSATHLIKVACEAATQQRSSVSIFGTQFSTPDGTGVRDYIHVEDLAEAHLKALNYLDAGGGSQTFNCGYGTGYSVRQVIEVIQTLAPKVGGKNFQVLEAPARAGDPASLIADSTKIKAMLGWKPQYNDLEVICESALKWELKLRNGRGFISNG